MNPETLIAKVKNMQPPSPVAAKLLALLNRANTDNAELIHVIKCDSVLTAKLLSVCNSAFYGGSQSISSVDHAVLRLGHHEIYRLVLACNFGDALSRSLPGYSIEAQELWQHSLITAIAAERVIADGCHVAEDPSVAYTAGLIHDIGKIVLNEALDSDTQTHLRRLVEKEGQSRIAAEKTVLETDHGEIGACLLQRWKLPDNIVEAVRNHHQPTLKPRPQLSAVIHVANLVAHEAGSAPGWAGFAVQAEENVAEALGIGPDTTDRILITAHQALQRIEEQILVK